MSEAEAEAGGGGGTGAGCGVGPWQRAFDALFSLVSRAACSNRELLYLDPGQIQVHAPMPLPPQVRAQAPAVGLALEAAMVFAKDFGQGCASTGKQLADGCTIC